MIRLNFNIIDALRRAMAELLGGAQPVALGAEAADVAVMVGASATEGDDVVWHGCCHDQPLRGAVTA